MRRIVPVLLVTALIALGGEAHASANYRPKWQKTTKERQLRRSFASTRTLGSRARTVLVLPGTSQELTLKVAPGETLLRSSMSQWREIPTRPGTVKLGGGRYAVRDARGKVRSFDVQTVYVPEVEKAPSRPARYGLTPLLLDRRPRSAVGRAFDDGVAAMVRQLPRSGPMISLETGEVVADAVAVLQRLEADNSNTQGYRRVVRRRGDELVATYFGGSGDATYERGKVTYRLRRGDLVELEVELPDAVAKRRGDQAKKIRVVWGRPSRARREAYGLSNDLYVQVRRVGGDEGFSFFESTSDDGKVSGIKTYGDLSSITSPGRSTRFYDVNPLGGRDDRY